MKVKHLLLILILAIILIHSVQAEKLKITLVANSIDYQGSTGLFKCLRAKGIEMQRIPPAKLNNTIKKESYLIILGGPDAPGGTGAVVENLLNKSEISGLREKGVKALYVKKDVWASPQKIFIVAGNTRKETSEAGEIYCSNIANLILNKSEKTLNASVQVEGTGVRYNSTYGAYFIRYVLYSLVNTGNTKFNPTVDIFIYGGKNYSTLIYSNSQIESNPGNLTINAHWLDNFTLNQKIDSGNYLIVLNVRNGTNPEIVNSSKEEFSV